MMSSLKTPMHLAWNELKHGWKHFAVFIACLALGIAVMGTVNSLGDIIENSLESEAQSLLGGDVEIRIRGLEATDEEREFIRKYGDISYVATLRSMLYTKNQNTLVEIKSVDDAYPLLGELEFNEQVSRAEVFTNHGIVVDTILLSQLNLNLGDVVKIGEMDFTIKATLKTEPDRVVQLFTFGPRVMMSQASLRTAGLVNPFSLIEHRYRVLVPENINADEIYEKKMEDELAQAFPNTSWHVRTGGDGNQMLERFITQLLSFLSLSALATFLIAGIGIGSSARAYLEKKIRTIAILKSLGAERKTVLQTYILVLAALIVSGGIFGIIAAYSIVSIALPYAAEIIPSLARTSEIDLWPIFLSFWYGLLISYLFSIPPLLNSINIRPASLFRNKVGILSLKINLTIWRSMVVIVSILLLTLILTANDLFFMLSAISMMLITFALFYGCSTTVKLLAKHITIKKPWLKLALGNLHRPGATTGTVIYAIGISLTVLITLTLTEANFQKRIDQLVNEDAPSIFMIDIQPHQKAELELLLSQYANQEHIMVQPMIRGRITERNGQAIIPEQVDDEIRWAVRGDRGLSYSATSPKNANIIAGEWWDEDYKGAPLLSVDKRFLSGMDLKIGDTLTVNVLGEDIVATIANARDIDYTTFQINFALMLSPGVLEDFPQTYLATIHLKNNAKAEAELVRDIAKDLPGVTMIRTTEAIELVKEVMGHIATALSITVAISLVAGLLVLTSALNATLEQRLYDTAIFKILGARKKDILKGALTEWILLAIATAFIAATIGTLSSYLILARFPGQNFSMMPEVTLITIILCVLVICITGYLGNRRLFTLKPSKMLRNN